MSTEQAAKEMMTELSTKETTLEPNTVGGGETKDGTEATCSVSECEDKVDGDEEEYHDDLFKKCSVPLFNRVHTVDLNATCTTCDCYHFLRAGFFCPHMVASANAVFESSGTKFEGFKQDSVSVRWWTDFMYYGYRSVDSYEEEDLVKIFHHLAQNDAKGPKFPFAIPSSMRIQPPIEDLPAMERIKNYPGTAISEMLNKFADKFDGVFSTTNLPRN